MWLKLCQKKTINKKNSKYIPLNLQNDPALKNKQLYLVQINKLIKYQNNKKEIYHFLCKDNLKRIYK